MLRSTWSAMIYSYSSDFFAFSLSFSEMSNFLLFFLYSSTQNTDAARCNVWPKEEGVWQTLLDFSLLSLSLFDWLKPFPFLVVRNASNFGTCERTRFSSHSRDNHVKVAFYSLDRIFNWNWNACQLGQANFRLKTEVQTHFTVKFLRMNFSLLIQSVPYIRHPYVWHFFTENRLVELFKILFTRHYSQKFRPFTVNRSTNLDPAFKAIL